MNLLKTVFESGKKAGGAAAVKKLCIVIPAYNEEQSIQSIIERCLAASSPIREKSAVQAVEIVVVSDGSTDRTVEIARKFTDRIRLIEFEKNRGYGAAILAGWQNSDADLLGFLDADGTCDPLFFSDLCRVIESEKADVAIGCRIHAQSKMPLVRKIGNSIFSALLTMFSKKRVRDTASGMRVVRRRSLPKLLPLPSGLDFTPAMSARSILSDDLKMTETDMPYADREGQSKLNLLKDGVRFLSVIFKAALLYCPFRLLGLLGVVCLAYAVFLMAWPVWHYVQNRFVEEWMIYRFVVSHLSGLAACFFFSTAYLSERMVRITLASSSSRLVRGWLGGFFTHRFFWAVPSGLMIFGAVLVMPSFVELMTTGNTYEHWSRFIAMSFFGSTAIALAITKMIDYSLDLIAARLIYLKSNEDAEIARPARG